MVFPLFDDNTGRERFPFVNYAFIAINVLVFVLLQDAGAPNNRFTYNWSTVPEEIVTGHDVQTQPQKREHPITGEALEVPGLGPTHIPGLPDFVAVYLTLITSMFMHGGWAHILGNMLFLWIFGDNVEDYLGHFRYILFYLVAGIVASLSHVTVTMLVHGDPLIPSLGASGAISGVLGGYLLLFPQRRVTVILFRFLTEVPAWVAIGIWFLFQIINSLGALGDEQGGGVAYGAHIGGFIFGLITIKLFAAGIEKETYRRAPPRVFS